MTEQGTKRSALQLTTVAVVESVEADPRLGDWPSVSPSHPGGPRRDAAGGRMATAGQTLRESALRCTAYFLPAHRASWTAILLAFLIGSALVRRRGLAAQRRGCVAVGGTAVAARLLPGIRVAALLRPAAVRLGVMIETPGELHHEASGPGASDPSAGFSLDAIFIERCRSSFLV